MLSTLQVTAQLMAPAGQRVEFEQGVSSARTAVDGYRQFDFSQSPVVRHGYLRLRAALQSGEYIWIVLATQWVIDSPSARRTTAQ